MEGRVTPCALRCEVTLGGLEAQGLPPQIRRKASQLLESRAKAILAGITDRSPDLAHVPAGVSSATGNVALASKEGLTPAGAAQLDIDYTPFDGTTQTFVNEVAFQGGLWADNASVGQNFSAATANFFTNTVGTLRVYGPTTLQQINCQDTANFSLDATFESALLLPKAAFVHGVTAGNIGAAGATHETIIGNPLCNNNPNAILLVTHNFSADNLLEPQPYGVLYDGSHWRILHESNYAPMVVGRAYNVLLLN